GFFIEDLRTLELGWWDERQCNAAFVQLMGQEGITSAVVMEIAPGRTLPPVKFALDELIYVLQGRGVSTVWTADGAPKKTFEWQHRSLFQIGSNSYLQLGNMRGDRPARVLRYSYLPLATSLVTEPDFYFNNPFQDRKSTRLNSSHTEISALPLHDALPICNMRGDRPARVLRYSYLPLATSLVTEPDFYFNNPFQRSDGSKEVDAYSEAKLVENGDPSLAWGGSRSYWFGNFFPDMAAWDKLTTNERGGMTVTIMFPNSEMSCHMSV